MNDRSRQIVKQLLARRSRMDTEFNQWNPHFKELRTFMQPSRGRFYLGQDKGNSTVNKSLIDSTARMALRTFSSGLMAGITSPSRPWFRIKMDLNGDQESEAVKEWAHTAQSRMYEVLRQSNVYGMLHHCYNQLGLYGSWAGIVTNHFDDVIMGHALPMGTYRISEGHDERIEYLHRDIETTVAGVYRQFGEAASPELKRAYNAGRHHDEWTIVHCIEPRRERNPNSSTANNMAFASMYYEYGKNHLLSESGFEMNNILAPRWVREQGESYSVESPGMIALGDSIQLQSQHRDKAIATQKMYDPPLQGGLSAANTLRNVPGGVTVTNDQNGLRPIYDVQPNIEHLRLDIQETQERIREAFFVDLFLMTSLSDRRQITAREIAERHEEKLLILGPVLEALDHDLLQPLIEITFHYMQKARILPEPPEEIIDQPVNVEYISALAQAQKAVGVAPIERTIGFAATLEQMKPGTMDNIDADQALRDFADFVGPPPGILNSQDEVKKTREARAEAQQTAQAVEAAQPLAQAAKLISEANQRGAEGIQQGSPL